MTEQFQWTTMSIVIGVVVLVVFGLCAMYDRQRRIRDLDEDLEGLCLDLYLGRDAHAERPVGLVHKPVRRLPLRLRYQPQLISPRGLAWLEHKLGQRSSTEGAPHHG